MLLDECQGSLRQTLGVHFNDAEGTEYHDSGLLETSAGEGDRVLIPSPRSQLMSLYIPPHPFKTLSEHGLGKRTEETGAHGTVCDDCESENSC